MSDQFDFWAAWSLRQIYFEHPASAVVEFDKSTAPNFWPTNNPRRYFSGLKRFLVENNYIVDRSDIAGPNLDAWYGVALTEKGYRTLANLPKSLRAKTDPRDIAKIIFGPLANAIGSSVRGASIG